MRKRCLCIALLLTACAPQARLNELVDTASGTIHTVRDSVDDIQDRWEKVQSGATLLKNGVNQLREAAH
jgi:hypothetical protein